ncbi:Por secretion system C-terminal sorting domain-containing protein [Catalinimonas alkaloidigena]|uniref:Por secretion system C-terminal sorting domain-containing protein n=1 Tax=Catalinimonas alkaloidigena TaxID=1075417 RepID=A0A1G9LM49_9BACT|nr:T9SS type A sorting domain-containing protein [Catalinimonas alkaloidigena]SDL63020.1 Por secretion system C-terminal sorting domain-containing protein [Catalinimonas alkaloidigena]
MKRFLFFVCWLLAFSGKAQPDDAHRPDGTFALADTVTALRTREAGVVPPDTLAEPRQTAFSPALLQLYPNPATHELTLSGGFTAGGTVRLRLIGPSGKVVRETTQTADGNALRVPIAALPRGLYFVEVWDEQNYYTRKFTKE